MNFSTGKLRDGAYVRLYSRDNATIRFVVGYEESQSAALDSVMTKEEAKALGKVLCAFGEKMPQVNT